MSNHSEFINALSTISNPELRKAVKTIYESTHGALTEGHKDRTTGGNWFGKTIRDQNNHDSEWGEYRDTKTAPETKRRYGFSKDGVKGMGMSGKFGSSWDIKNDGLNSTDDNSVYSKFGRADMKAHEKRFFDPHKVLERDEGGEREQAEFDREEALKNDESFANMADIRKHDQLNNTISAWKDKLSTSKYDYDDTMRDGFARLFADNMSDHPTFGSNKPGVWDAHFKNGLKLFDRNKEFVTSDEGRELQSSNFEYKYNHPETELTSDDPKTAMSTDDEDVDKWIRAGYQSGDMFGEAIDKIAKVTGQKELCEAVKQIYKVCIEAKN